MKNKNPPSAAPEWIILALCLIAVAGMLLMLGGCTMAPKPTESQGIGWDAQTGKQDGGLIDSFTGPDGTVWTHMSDDFRADYIRLLNEYGSDLADPPDSPDEGWNLTPPISCNGGVRDTMKQLRSLDRSGKKLPNG